jgi:hypothetical protein
MNMDKKDIVTINLKYGSSFKPLKTLAFAQLLAKALFLCNRPLNISELAKEVASIIGIKNVSEGLIKNGLDYLEEINKVINKNDKWFLCKETRIEIAKDLDSARFQIRGVLKRHFPGDIEEKKLKDWFREASINFFSYYGDEWVSVISKNLDKKVFFKGKTIDELLLQSIKNHKFERIEQLLINGFISFLSSEDNSDQQYLMLISQAMFSARLVAADVGVDPITLQELKDAKFILDTNVLLAIALESSRLAKSINSLEGALKAINANLIYLHTTKEEYGRALTGHRGEIIHLAEIFPNEILKDAADDFVATANARGCSSKEDYERFFSSLVEIPKELSNGYKISLEDGNEIEEVRKIAEEDATLKEKIQKCALKFRARWRGPKRELALKHDSTLLHVADFIKKEGYKCWVLSLDKSLQSCAISYAGPHGIPILLSVSALIEILAINNAGPDLDATNFAPLLAKIILNECMPPLNTFILQDLVALHKIQEKARELPPEDLKVIIKEIAKARIEGKSIESTELQLKVNRMYQESSMHITEKLENTRIRAEAAERELKKEKQLREDRDISYKIKEIKRRALLKLIRQIVVGIAVAISISFVILILYKRYFDQDSKKEILGYILAALPFVIDAWKLVPRAILEYRNSCKEAQKIEKSWGHNAN